MSKKILFIFLLLLPLSLIGKAENMTFYQTPVYIPVDSLTNKQIYKVVNLHLSFETAIVNYNGSTCQLRETTDSIATFKVYKIQKQDSLIRLKIGQILSVTVDTIYLSACNMDDQCKPDRFTNTLAIHRSQLKGISYIKPPSIKTVTSFYGGIGINIKDTGKKREKLHRHYYMAELGYSYGKNKRIISYSFYGGSEFLFNRNNFLVAPKVGANLSIYLFMLGSEMALYTNFKSSTLCFKPYIAAGLHSFKVSIGYNLHFYNKKEFFLNAPTLTLTVPFGIKEK